MSAWSAERGFSEILTSIKVDFSCLIRKIERGSFKERGRALNDLRDLAKDSEEVGQGLRMKLCSL
jgi:hypothetical protein